MFNTYVVVRGHSWLLYCLFCILCLCNFCFECIKLNAFCVFWSIPALAQPSHNMAALQKNPLLRLTLIYPQTLL